MRIFQLAIAAAFIAAALHILFLLTPLISIPLGIVWFAALVYADRQIAHLPETRAPLSFVGQVRFALVMPFMLLGHFLHLAILASTGPSLSLRLAIRRLFRR